MKFDLYNNHGEGVDSTGLYTDGASPTNVGSIDLTATGVNLHSGDVMQASLSYDGTTLTVTIADAQTGKTATESYVINIPATVGGSTAYVGFTGATGGLVSTQDILTWTFTQNATKALVGPSPGVTAPGAVTSLTLTSASEPTIPAGPAPDGVTESGIAQSLVTPMPAAPAISLGGTVRVSHRGGPSLTVSGHSTRSVTRLGQIRRRPPVSWHRPSGKTPPWSV